jgi:hypothetical protein
MSDLFSLFSPRIIPYCGIDSKNPNKNYFYKTSVYGAHSEIARPEYDYVFNSDGIRSIEFSTKPEIVAIGCSITMGQGVPQELRWSDLLSKEIGMPIGNISYSGAAINKNVISFIAMTKQYNYTPKILIANFANFERFFFIDGSASYMRDWYANHKSKKIQASMPWDYEEILPYEWVYYNNLTHINILEAFCRFSGIKLIWSTWSTALSEDQEIFLQNNFNNYIQDPTRKDFPKDFEYLVNPEKVSELTRYYKMHNWDNILCHLKYKDMYDEIFDYGYDYHKISGGWGPGAHWPHPGVHRHLHWADFYKNELISRNWI